MNPALLTLNNISVLRAGAAVLRDVHWYIARGENWAVIGANGAGKSSLAAAIAGDAAVCHGGGDTPVPDCGEIEYNFGGDADPCSQIASVSFQLHRQFVAQSDGYYQSRWYLGEEDATLTAGKVLRASAGKSANARRRIDSIVRLMSLARLLKRQTLHLSTGEMRRLLIARALLKSPALLLLDEPFIGLDAAARALLMKKLERLMRAGQQLIFFTARPWELPKGISQTLWLKDGEVLGAAQRGSSSEKRLERLAFPRPARSTLPIQNPTARITPIATSSNSKRSNCAPAISAS